MLSQRQREILTRHWDFLAKNIVWTEDLSAKLREQQLITDSTIREINKKESREEKIKIVLESVIVRGSNAYEKFWNTLLRCGFHFISDFLREEDIVSEKLSPKEMFKKFKFLERLKENERQELEDYFTTKLRDDSLKMIWKEDDFRDKAKAIEAKRDQLEQYFVYEENLKKRQSNLKALETAMQKDKETIVVMNAEINYLQNALKEAEKKRHNDIGAQLKYTQANENQLERTKQRLKVCENSLRDIHYKMAKVIGRKKKADDEKDAMALQENEFAFVVEDFDTVIDSYQDLLSIRLHYNDAMKEKQYILQHMGHNPYQLDKIKLKDAYRDFVAENEQKMIEMEEKLKDAQQQAEDQKELLESLTKEKEAKNRWQMGANVWQGAIMGIMRNQLQDVKKENRLKDTRIKTFESEISKLRARISELERERALAASHTSNGSSNQTHNHVCRNSVDLKPLHHRNSLHVDYDLQSVSSHSSANLPPAYDEHELIDAKTEAARAKARVAEDKKKRSMLPPLKPVYQLDSVDSPSTPRRGGLKHRGHAPPRHSPVDRNPMGLPDGLTTAPVKLEKRPREYNVMPHGMKSLHNTGKAKFENALNPTKVRH